MPCHRVYSSTVLCNSPFPADRSLLRETNLYELLSLSAIVSPSSLPPPRQSLRQFCHSFATFFRPIPILARRRTSLLLLLLLRFIGYYIGILYITRSVQHDKSPQQWRLPSLLERLVRSRRGRWRAIQFKFTRKSERRHTYLYASNTRVYLSCKRAI